MRKSSLVVHFFEMSNQSKQHKITEFFRSPPEESTSEGEQETEVSDKIENADEHDNDDANKSSETDKNDQGVASDELELVTDAKVAAEKKIDKPSIWTDKMWVEKQQLYPWLLCKNGKLGCNFCASAKDLGPQRTQGIYLSKEWQTISVTYNGLSQKAKLSSLRKIFNHLRSDAHKKAEEILNQQKKNSMCMHVDAVNSKWLETTRRVFRRSYYIAKNDRPMSNHKELIDLQTRNGLDMGTGLHSRFSAAAIIDHIGHEMRSTICKSIKKNSGKLSILIDESTTVSDISTLIVYLDAQLEISGEPQFLFLDLVELTNGESADEIHKALVACLKLHGFDMNYFREHFVAFTSDRASVNWEESRCHGVTPERLLSNLITWHCKNHRLELAVDDAIKDLLGVNHFKTFMMMLLLAHIMTFFQQNCRIYCFRPFCCYRSNQTILAESVGTHISPSPLL